MSLEGMDAVLTALEERAPCFSFRTPEARELAITALTHSSLSATRNNKELAKVGEAAGKAAAVEALFLSPGKHTGKHYNDITLGFTTKNLGAIGKGLKLDEAMRLDKGVPYVSEEMFARGLEALLGVVKVTEGQEALLKAIKSLKIISLDEMVAPTLDVYK
ncbi:hypothetical protein JCM6882_009574 [Rhodosporidiobolus microsporus]